MISAVSIPATRCHLDAVRLRPFPGSAHTKRRHPARSFQLESLDEAGKDRFSLLQRLVNRSGLRARTGKRPMGKAKYPRDHRNCQHQNRSSHASCLPRPLGLAGTAHRAWQPRHAITEFSIYGGSFARSAPWSRAIQSSRLANRSSSAGLYRQVAYSGTVLMNR